MGRLYLPKGVKAVAVDSNDYTKINPEHIPADERFLYTYVFRMNFHLRDFALRLRFMKMRQANSETSQEKKKKKSIDDDNESIESVSDDEFDRYLGKNSFSFKYFFIEFRG